MLKSSRVILCLGVGLGVSLAPMAWAEAKELSAEEQSPRALDEYRPAEEQIRDVPSNEQEINQQSSSAGPAGVEIPGFTIRIDCHGTNGYPSWAPTDDDIEVEVWINGDWFSLAEFPMGNCSYEDSYRIFAPFFASAVSAIRISTDGSNMFWIDELSLLNAYDEKIAGWRVDNNVGFCLSEDEDDGKNPYCIDYLAYDAFIFRK